MGSYIYKQSVYLYNHKQKDSNTIYGFIFYKNHLLYFLGLFAN